VPVWLLFDTFTATTQSGSSNVTAVRKQLGNFLTQRISLTFGNFQRPQSWTGAAKKPGVVIIFGNLCSLQ
jgi:hypothetical protein